MMSQVLANALADPSYLPYCLRCTGLGRMRKVAPFFWRCPVCGAEHDERENLKADDESIITALPGEDAVAIRLLNDRIKVLRDRR